MKYVLMFADTQDPALALPDDVAQDVYQRMYGWFEEHGSAGRIVETGAELQPVATATTVRSGEGDKPVVVDGPFAETKEVIGGFTVIDVEDMDAAIAMARTWPALEHPGHSVEIRPMVVDYSQFE